MRQKRRVFFSFHFDNDVMRVQLVRNIGTIEENKPVSANDWEQVKRSGDDAIRRWIDSQMEGKSCVVVLVGSQTAFRPWVQYEIVKGWNAGKGIVGIYIHGLKCARNGACTRGSNPFDSIFLGQNGPKLSSIVRCYDPPVDSAYSHIAANIEQWIEEAIAIRVQRR